MKKTAHIIITALLLAVTALANDLDGLIAESIRPDNPHLQAPFLVILVVSASAVSPGPHSNSNTPTGLFEIEEVLRGHLRGAKIIELKWRRPRSFSADHVAANPRYVDEDPWYNRPLKKEWLDSPLIGPQIGARIIVLANPQSRPTAVKAGDLGFSNAVWANMKKSRRLPYLVVRSSCRYTDKNFQTVLQNMGPTDRNPQIQRILISLILACTPLSFVLFAATAGASRRKLFKFWLAIIAVAPVSVLLWLLFETGNVTGGIRIDLLIIFPALAINTLMAIRASVAMLIYKRRHKGM